MVSGLKMTGVVPKIERAPVYGLRPNENGGIWVPQRARPRRNRKNEPIRSMTRENRYSSALFLLSLRARSQGVAWGGFSVCLGCHGMVEEES